MSSTVTGNKDNVGVSDMAVMTEGGWQEEK